MEYKDLGQLVTTASIHKLAEENEGFRTFMTTCLGRYMKNDWGNLAQEDYEQNDHAIKSGEERILASYPFPKNRSWQAANSYGAVEDKLWIITEWDHSVTTILFPSEY